MFPGTRSPNNINPCTAGEILTAAWVGLTNVEKLPAFHIINHHSVHQLFPLRTSYLIVAAGLPVHLSSINDAKNILHNVGNKLFRNFMCLRMDSLLVGAGLG
jgi:hypothetical protein